MKNIKVYYALHMFQINSQDISEENSEVRKPTSKCFMLLFNQ
jgi:hypothetical protein